MILQKYHSNMHQICRKYAQMYTKYAIHLQKSYTQNMHKIRHHDDKDSWHCKICRLGRYAIKCANMQKKTWNRNLNYLETVYKMPNLCNCIFCIYHDVHPALCWWRLLAWVTPVTGRGWTSSCQFTIQLHFELQIELQTKAHCHLPGWPVAGDRDSDWTPAAWPHPSESRWLTLPGRAESRCQWCRRWFTGNP